SSEVERVDAELVRARLAEREARVLVAHEALQASRDRLEERLQVEVRYDGRVHVEEQLQPIALGCEALVVERVLDRERDLVGDALEEVLIALAGRALARAAEAQQAELAARRPEREVPDRGEPVGGEEVERPALVSGGARARDEERLAFREDLGEDRAL